MEFEWPNRIPLGFMTRNADHIMHRLRYAAKVKGALVGGMSLTTEQVQLVTQSYALIARSPRSYSELFYHRLLLDYPFARALFPDDMTHQIDVFAKTIDVLIENVASLDRLSPTLSDLAKRHVKYGVRAYHYAVVGTVLINTFEEILGIYFTADIRQAWEAVYGETASTMIAEAYCEPGHNPPFREDGSEMAS